MTLDDEKTRIGQYKTLFSSDLGKQVLDDLSTRFLHQGGIGIVHAQANNPIGLAFIEGQRELILTVQRWLTMDLEAFVRKVEEQQSLPHGDPYGGT